MMPEENSDYFQNGLDFVMDNPCVSSIRIVVFVECILVTELKDSKWNTVVTVILFSSVLVYLRPVSKSLVSYKISTNTQIKGTKMQIERKNKKTIEFSIKQSDL